MSEDQELIAVRIKDGIFVGNMTAAADRDFLSMNKITHIINCAGGEVLDFFSESPEFKYLTFNWRDAPGTVNTTMLFDAGDKNINHVVEFVDEAVDQGDCALVHSIDGTCRSPALVAAYFVVKYGWRLESALRFLEMAHPETTIKPYYMRQLRTFAAKHPVTHDIFDENVDDSQFGLDNDQWMLRNTLLNGLTYAVQKNHNLYVHCTSKVDIGEARSKDKAKRKRLTFVDTRQGVNVAPLNSSPVVNGKLSHHLDPNKEGVVSSYVGSRGPVVLRSPRSLSPIIRRTISPCSQRPESDPKVHPKGRQEIPLINISGVSLQKIDSDTKILNSDRPITAAAIPNVVVRTNSQHSEGNSSANPSPSGSGGKQIVTKTIIESTSSHLSAARSPFATLTSSHKYRTGSPLPKPKAKDAKGLLRSRDTLSKDAQGQNVRIRIASLPSSSRVPPGSSPTSVNAPSRSSSQGGRTSSPHTGSPRNPPINSLNIRTVGNVYKGIAPQRSSSASASALNITLPLEGERSGTNRTLSPGTQRRSGSIRKRSPAARSFDSKVRPTSPRGSTTYDVGGKTGANRTPITNTSGGLVKRELPAAISSHRF